MLTSLGKQHVRPVVGATVYPNGCFLSFSEHWLQISSTSVLVMRQLVMRILLNYFQGGRGERRRQTVFNFGKFMSEVQNSLADVRKKNNCLMQKLRKIKVKCRNSFRFKCFGTHHHLSLYANTQLLIWFLNLFQHHLMQHRDEGFYVSGSPNSCLLVVGVKAQQFNENSLEHILRITQHPGQGSRF